MDNQICKNCGQANFPNANACTKCGNALTPTADNSFGVSNAEPATSNANRQFTPNTGKKSSKMFWIIGIAGVLLVLGIGLIGIVGVGSYFYFSSKDDVAYDYPNDKPADNKNAQVNVKKGDDDNSLSDVDFPSTGNDKDLSDSQTNKNANITNKQLTGFYRDKKPNIGKWKLQNVVENFSKASFENRDAGVRASYKNGSKRLNHNFSFYKSTTALDEDFDTYKDKVKSSGGKVRTTTATSVIYVKGGLVYFAFHNPQGGFHEISAKDGKDILKYHDDYFDIKK